MENYHLVVLGTLIVSLDPGRARWAVALLDTARSVVTVALRTRWDPGAYQRGHGL